MKSKTLGKVLSQKQLAPGIFDLVIETKIAEEAGAGQFVGVYTRDASALLPRPISICGVSDDKKALRLVYRVAGKGTSELRKTMMLRSSEFSETGMISGTLRRLPKRAETECSCSEAA